MSRKVFLREPTGHFGGYAWTFAKGAPKKGEAPAETALRHVSEETGYRAEILEVLPHAFAGTTSTTALFIMARKGGRASSGPTRLRPAGSTRRKPRRSSNKPRRRRDAPVSWRS